MNYNSSDDEKREIFQSDENNSEAPKNTQIGDVNKTDYSYVSYSPTTGYFSHQSQNLYNSPLQSKKKLSHKGLIIFSCLLGLLFMTALFSVVVFNVVNSELGQLFSSNIQNWVENKNNSHSSEKANFNASDDNDLRSDGGSTNNAFVPIENPPTIDIVSVKDRDVEKVYDESGREILTIPDIVERVSPSVVGIVNTQLVNTMMSTGIGSGIIFSEDGFILTNQHVIDNASELSVYLNDGTEYSAKVIGEDEKADIAIIKIDATKLTPAEFGDSDVLRIGDLAVAIGNPASLDLQGTTTSGIISALDREIMLDMSGRTLELIQTDAAINPGNSGGPLINKYGQVIGINTVKLSTSSYEGICFAIPSNVAKPIIDDLLTYGHVKGYPTIGIEGYQLTEYEAKVYSSPKGVLISRVIKNSNAYSAGLKVNDVITQCEGESVTSIADINLIKNKMKVGDTITLTVYRDGDTFDVDVVLMDEIDISD